MKAQQRKFAKTELAQALVLAGVVGVSGVAHAQSTSDIVAAQGSAVQVQTRGDVAVVQIAAPSAKGLSHNQFNSYSVGTAGAVMNNAKTNAISALAGEISANPALTQGSAKIILNEVVSANISRINGTQEIAGDRAALVVTNPNGMIVDNASFINTSRATLASARPEVADGELKALVTDGRAAMVVNRVNADVDQLDLIASHVVTDAKTSIEGGRSLNITGGSNRVDYASNQATAIDPSSPFATDSSGQKRHDVALLGATQAGRISIVSTSADRGILGEAVSLQARDGDLTIGGKNVSLNARVTDRVIEDSSYYDYWWQTGWRYIEGYTKHTTQDIATGSVKAAGDLKITGDTVRISATEVKGKNVEIKGETSVTLGTQSTTEDYHRYASDKLNFWWKTDEWWRKNVTQHDARVHGSENVSITGEVVQIDGSDAVAGGKLRVEGRSALVATPSVQSKFEKHVGHEDNNTIINSWQGGSVIDNQSLQTAVLTGGTALGLTGDQVSLRAAVISTDGDAIINANRNLRLDNSTYRTGNGNYDSWSNSGGAFGGHQWNEENGVVHVAGTNLNAGGQVFLTANQGVDVIASRVKGGKGVYGDGGAGDVRLDVATGQNIRNVTDHNWTVFGIVSKDDNSQFQQDVVKGAEVRSDADITLLTKANVEVVGSLLEAADNLTIKAGGYVAISAAEAREQSGYQKLWWTTGATSTTKEGQWTGEVSIKQHQETGSLDMTSAVSSNLNAGNNVNIDAGSDLTVTGSNITAGNNVDLKASDITFNSAKETVEKGNFSQVGGLSLWATAGVDKVGAGLNVGVSNVNTNTASSTPVASTITAGGNVTREATGQAEASSSLKAVAIAPTADEPVAVAPMAFAVVNPDTAVPVVVTPVAAAKGTITDQATVIKAGGAVNDLAGSIVSKEAVATVEKTVDQSSVNVGISVVADVSKVVRPVFELGTAVVSGGDVGAAIEKVKPVAELVKDGKWQDLPITATASLGVDVKNSSTTSNTQTAVVSKTEANNINLTGNDTVKLVGTNLNATENVTIQGGTVDILAAQNSANTSTNATNVNVGASITTDLKANATASLTVAADTSKENKQTTTAAGAQITSGKDVTVTAADALTTKATGINAGGNISLIGSTVDMQAASNTTATDSVKTSGTGGINVAANLATLTASSVGLNVAVKDVKAQSSTSTDVGNTLVSGGTVAVKSTGSIGFKGNITSAGNTVLNAGTGVTVGALNSSTQSTGSNLGVDASLKLAVSGDSVSGGGGSFGFQNGSTSAQSTSQAASSISSTGGSVAIAAPKDVTLVGTNVNAGQAITITAGNDINATALQGSSSGTTNSLGVKVGAEGSSSSAGVNFGFTKADTATTGTTQTAGSLTSGGNTTLTAGKDVNIASSVNAGGSTSVTAPGAVNVLATENTSTSTGSSIGVDIGVKVGFTADAVNMIDLKGNVAVADNNANEVKQTGTSVAAATDVGVKAGEDITLTGTKVTAGNNVDLVAGGNLNLNPTQSAANSSSNSVAVGGNLSLTKETNGAGFNVKVTDANSTTTSQAPTLIAGGNNVTLSSGGDIALTGSATAGNNLTVTAPGNISVSAATNTENSSSNSVGVGGTISIAMKDGAPTSGSGSFNLNLANSSTDAVLATGGALTATAGNLTVTAGNNLSTEGTAITAGQNANLTAGGQVTLASADSASNAQSSALDVKLTATAKPNTNFGASADVKAANSLNNSLTQAPTQVTAGGDVQITSGADVLLAGGVKAVGSVTITAPGNVTIPALTRTEDKAKSDLTFGVGGNITLDGTGAPTAGDGRLEIASSSSSSTSSGVTGGTLASGSGNVTINAGKTLTLQATQLAAPAGQVVFKAADVVKSSVSSSASATVSPSVKFKGSFLLSKDKKEVKLDALNVSAGSSTSTSSTQNVSVVAAQ